MDEPTTGSHKIIKIVEWCVFTLILLIGLVVLSPLLPTKNMGSAYSIVSGSMEPTIPTGALAVIHSANNDNLAQGTIIAFTSPQNPNQTIIHRIYKVNDSEAATSYQTKGDNNNVADSWTVMPNAIKGVYSFHVPYVGYIISWLKTPLGFFIAIVVPAIIFGLMQIKKIRQGIEEEVDKRTRKRQFDQNDGSTPSSVNKSRISSLALVGLVSLLGLSVLAQSAYALFSSNVEINGIELGTSNYTPTPTPTPTSTPTPTPTSSPTPTPSSSPTPTPTSVPGSHLVINEVYYHDQPSPGQGSCGGLNISNTGNNVTIQQICSSITTNASNNSTDININNGANGQWIELFNPTNQPINLKNWSITTLNGTQTVNPNVSIPSGGFALLSKSASTFQSWTLPADVVTINVGGPVGFGLNSIGDRLMLKNPGGTVIDSLSYGSDVSQLNPSIPLVPLASSFSRQPNGLDTNFASDFAIKSPPTPGQ